MSHPRRRAVVERRQTRRLKKVIRRAYRRSSFYRELYDKHGVNPRAIKSAKDIVFLPFIEREDLRRILETEPRRLYTRRVTKRFWSQTTSGSTGVPIRIAATKWERRRILLGILRTYRMAGMTLTDRHVVIKDPIDIRPRSIIENFGVLRHKYYSIYDSMNSIIDQLTASPGPDILRSMPSDLSNLVQTARTRGVNLPKPKVIFSDSETLDSPTREAIEQFFDVPLLDFYANTETGIAAFQTSTSNGRYLIPEDLVLLETINNPKLNGGDKDIVLTGLINKTTPIIRYRIGDVSEGIVEREPSAAYPSIKSIHGKYLDFLVRTDGSIVSSHAAKQNLTHLPGIKKFQVKQDEIGTVVIRIQKGEDWSPATEVQIRQDFARDFGPSTKILIEFVADLSKSTNNYRKFKVIESSVAQQLLTATHTEPARPDNSDA